VTAEGRLAATWAEDPDAALVMLCHSPRVTVLLLVFSESSFNPCGFNDGTTQNGTRLP
jgi:hypothetical protein